jgi:methylenetetrahydrofolate reductase (NADPH)
MQADGDQYAENVGVDWTAEQVGDLIDNGVKGIHFYTLNRSQATLKVYETLGLRDLTSAGGGR